MENQEWLRWRKIGSSDAAAIMGVSPWTTPYQLWEQKISGKQIQETPAMRRGKDLEPYAMSCFESMMGVKLESQVCVEHKDHHFITATLDGINEDKKILVEIKCPNAKTHSIASSGKEIPEHYMPQLQHQMEIKGYESMYYFSFDGQEGVILQVERDEDYGRELVDKETDFYRRILEWDPPELTDRDYISMDKDEVWFKLSERFKNVNIELKALSDEEKELRKALIHIAARKNSMGNGLKLSRSTQAGGIDYDRIPELQNIDKEKYRKPSFDRWRFSF